jgi:predicted transcriptional regulator YdeE
MKQPTFVDLPALHLIAVRALNDDAKSIRMAWRQLEEPLPSRRGRRFYGVCYGTGSQQGYYAAVEPESDTEIGALGFQLLTVPAGRYVRATLKDWNAHVDRIPEIVNTLEQDFPPDSSRPTIEFYRSQSELQILVPLRS